LIQDQYQWSSKKPINISYFAIINIQKYIQQKEL